MWERRSESRDVREEISLCHRNKYTSQHASAARDWCGELPLESGKLTVYAHAAPPTFRGSHPRRKTVRKYDTLAPVIGVRNGFKREPAWVEKWV